MTADYKYLDKPTLSNPKLYTTCTLLILTIFFIDLQIPLGVAGGVPYIVVVLVALWSSQPRFVIYLAIICSIMTLLGFYYSPSGGELWQVIFNRFLALFAIWITTALVLKWKIHEQEIYSFQKKIEQEKDAIYQATIYGAQHITNNLLNELKLVELEIKNHPEFDQEILSMFTDMQANATTLMQELSSVDKIDDLTIRHSIYPK